MNDLGRAFTFPFKDPHWITKFIIGGIFVVLGMILVGAFVLAGYFIQVTQRVMRKDPNPMPEWSDIGVKLVVGFKFCIVVLIYLLPVILLYIPFFIILFFATVSGGENLIAAMGSVYLVVIVFFLVIPYSIFLTLMMPIISYRFAERESMSDALKIGEVFRRFKLDWQNTTVVALIALGLQSLAGLGVIFIIIGIVFTIFYVYLVSAYLHGWVYNQHVSEEAAA